MSRLQTFIVGVVVGVVLGVMLGVVGFGGDSEPVVDGAANRRAAALLEQLRATTNAVATMNTAHLVGRVELFLLRQGKLPSSLHQLTESDARTGESDEGWSPEDHWGSPYAYRLLDDGKFQIISMGEDRQEGTEDDIVSPGEAR